MLWDFSSKCCQCRAAVWRRTTLPATSSQLPASSSQIAAARTAFASCSTFLQFVCGFTCPSLDSNSSSLRPHVSICVCVCVFFYLFGRMLCCRYLSLFRFEIDLTLGFYLLSCTHAFDTSPTGNLTSAVSCTANVALKFLLTAVIVTCCFANNNFKLPLQLANVMDWVKFAVCIFAETSSIPWLGRGVPKCSKCRRYGEYGLHVFACSETVYIIQNHLSTQMHSACPKVLKTLPTFMGRPHPGQSWLN